MEDSFKQITRRLDSIEKSQNLIYKDRDILEDILLKIDSLKGEVHTLQEEVKLLKDKVTKLEKNMTADTAEVHTKVEEIKDILSE